MKVFISSELDTNHPLVAASISLRFNLIQQSLLSFSAVESLPTKPYDIVFFSSPRATLLVNSLFFQKLKWPVYQSVQLNIAQIPSTGAGIPPASQHKRPRISNNGLANGGFCFLFRLAAWEAFHRYSLQHKSNALRFIKRY